MYNDERTGFLIGYMWRLNEGLWLHEWAECQTNRWFNLINVYFLLPPNFHFCLSFCIPHFLHSFQTLSRCQGVFYLRLASFLKDFSRRSQLKKALYFWSSNTPAIKKEKRWFKKLICAVKIWSPFSLLMQEDSWLFHHGVSKLGTNPLTPLFGELQHALG